MERFSNLISLILVIVIWGLAPQAVLGQSAIGQLQGMTGVTIDRGSSGNYSSSYSSSGVNWSEIWRAKAEAAAERRAEAAARARKEALRANEQGNSAYSYGNYSAAVEYYRKALRNSPSDATIRSNLKSAKDKLDNIKAHEKLGEQLAKKDAENRRVEEARKEAFVKKKQPAIDLIQSVKRPNLPTVTSTQNSALGSPKPGFGSDNLPVTVQRIGGLTQQEWDQARNYQQEIDRIQKVWPVPSKDIDRLTLLEMKRDDLWKKAISVPGLSFRDRESLRLKLYTKEIYANESQAMTLPDEQIRDWKIVPSKTNTIQNPTPSGTNAKDPESNSVVMNMLSDMATDKATKMYEQAGKEYVIGRYGEKAGPLFGDALAVTKIVMKTKSDGAVAGIVSTMDFALGKIKTPRAKATLEGGKVYKDYAKQSMTKFKDEMKKFSEEMGLPPIKSSE